MVLSLRNFLLDFEIRNINLRLDKNSSNKKSSFFNDPNLVLLAIVFILNDSCFIGSLTALDLHGFAVESFNIECVWQSVKVSWNQFEIFTGLFVLMTACQSGSV